MQGCNGSPGPAFEPRIRSCNPRIRAFIEYWSRAVERAISCSPMRLNDITLLGWIHTFFYAIAMITGAMQMARGKGTPSHRRRGNVYFLSMLIANSTALFIFTGADVIFRSGKPPVLGQGFGFIHWLSVFALALVLFG